MKQKLLFFLTALCFGFVSGVKADVVVPTPVYFEDFESASAITDVGTVTGFGELATGSGLFGKYYQNDPECKGGNRANYLTIETNAFATLEATNTKEVTISFWVNSYQIIQHSFSPWWNEMFAAWSTAGYDYTQGQTGYRDNGGDIGAFDVRTNLSNHAMLNTLWYDCDGNHITLDASWITTPKGSALDNNWHHVAYIMSNNMSHISIYIDGTIKCDKDITNIGHVDGFSGDTFWSNLSNLTKFTLGGLSQRWEDPDSPLGYDEIAIYSTALSAEQINAIITSKQYRYTVNAKRGSDKLKELNSGTAAPDESVTVAYPQYVLSGSSLYEAAAIGGNYAKTFEVTADNQVENIMYDESVTSNVFYYVEAEDVYTGTNQTSNLPSASNGKLGGRNTNSTQYKNLVNLPAGTWQITARMYVGNSNSHTVNFKADNEVVYTFERVANSGWYTGTSEEITLTKAATLSVAVDGAATTGLDWIYVQGTPTYEVIGATDNSTGYNVAFNKTPICITAGEKAHFKIVNHNSGSGNSWDNWYLFANETENTESHVLDVRPDQWCDGGVTQENTLESFNYVSDYNGATVDILVSLDKVGETYTMTSTTTIKKADGTDVSGSKIDTKTGLTQSKLYLYLSLQNSWIEIVNQDVVTTLGSNGYATFASPNALDLTKANLPSGLKAYKAQSVSTTSVHFEEFDQTVPANTGILFEGTASETYNIPVVANGTDVLENAFEVNTTGTITPAANTKYYALIKNSSPMAFGWFDPTSVTIPANKAYIPVANGSSARLVISFEDDDPMAINAIEVADTKAEGLKDGKYFIGNRIILVKNGMKFNANGQILK